MHAAVLRARYRTRQFLRALGERPNRETSALVDRYLGEAGSALFLTLSPRDRRHSARTAALLLDAGIRDHELIQAALLHDIGKGRQALWERIAFVLIVAANPPLLDRIARPGSGWRGALERARRHSSLGAQCARAAGYSERVAQLIDGHHDEQPTNELAMLQQADERA